MKNRKIIFVIFMIIVSLMIGFLLGKIFDVPGVTLDKKINPLHALSITVTLFIAIVIGIFIDREKEKNKVVKEIIIRRIDKTIETIELLFESVMLGRIKSEVAPGHPKRIHSSLKCSWAAFESNNINTPIEFSELELIAREIKNLLTNTPVSSAGKNPNAPVKAVDGYFIYSDARISEIGVELEKLKNKLFKLQLDVNTS